MPDQFPVPLPPFLRPRGRRFRGTVTTAAGTRSVSSRAELKRQLLTAADVARGFPAPAEQTSEEALEELLKKRPFTPAGRDPPLDPDFEELMKRNVTRETDELADFSRLLRRGVGRAAGAILGPIGVIIGEALTPSTLGSGELIPGLELPLPEPPEIPPPPPPELPPIAVDAPIPGLPPLPLPIPRSFPLPPSPPSPPLPSPSPSSSGTTAPFPSTPPTPSGTPSPVPSIGVGSPSPSFLPFVLPTRRQIRDDVKGRLRRLLLERLGQPAPSVAVISTPVPAPASRDTSPPGLIETLTGLGIGRLRLPRTAPSSSPGMSDSCTQCEVDKCVQRAMDKQRKSRRRKKGPTRRKQPKLCVSAPRSLSQLMKLLK